MSVGPPIPCNTKVYQKVFIGRGGDQGIRHHQQLLRLWLRLRLLRCCVFQVLDLGIDLLVVACALLYEPAPLAPSRAPD